MFVDKAKVYVKAETAAMVSLRSVERNTFLKADLPAETAVRAAT